MQNMTALMSLFARYYHYQHNSCWVFKDERAGELLSEEERQSIAYHLSQGIGFFAPDFTGTAQEGLRLIVDRQLAPSVLAHSAFCEQALAAAVGEGCGQYVLFASGYDSFSLRDPYPALRVFELDRPQMVQDKQRRVRAAGGGRSVAYIGCDLGAAEWPELLVKSGFDCQRPAFGSLLGLSHYLTPADFERLLARIATCWQQGWLCFDYALSAPDEYNRKNQQLAASAGEQMRSAYTSDEISSLLERQRWSVVEHLDASSAQQRFFAPYNRSAAQPMFAPPGVNYVLAVRK